MDNNKLNEVTDVAAALPKASDPAPSNVAPGQVTAPDGTVVTLGEK